MNRRLISSAAAIAVAAGAADAAAQASPVPEAVTVGAWTFRPLVEVRVRGEYRRHPFDVGGTVYSPTAVLFEDYGTTLPRATSREAALENQYGVAERARLGIAVDRGPVTAAVTLQDARVWGEGTPALAPAQPTLPSFAPSEAYLDLHTRSGKKVFLRVGRQGVSWGDGRLLGKNDWSATGRSLDAARFGFQIGDVDVEMLAAMLATPGLYQKPAQATVQGAAPGNVGGAKVWGSGAQLYGVNAIWRALPLLAVELTGLARITRDPLPSTLTPANTFVIDGRISGDKRGFRYAVEGAYELGKVAWYGQNRDLGAFAFAARASWETALPWHLTFGADGAYASGDDGKPSGTLRRFDPLLPDEHTLLSPMSLFSWSNLIHGGGTIGVRPIEELGFQAGYHYAALAQPGGRWTSAALSPIGAAPTNTARALGHEIDASLKITPWRAFEIDTGYGAFVRGSGADQILRASGRAASLQHWAYLQTTVRLP